MVQNPPANALEGRATHSSILAWRIPWPEEPGGLQSMGLQRVRQDLGTQPSPHHQNILWLLCLKNNSRKQCDSESLTFGVQVRCFYHMLWASAVTWRLKKNPSAIQETQA